MVNVYSCPILCARLERDAQRDVEEISWNGTWETALQAEAPAHQERVKQALCIADAVRF